MAGNKKENSWVAEKGIDGKTFGARIKDLMIDKDVTAKQVASATNISPSILTNCSKGYEVSPNSETVLKLANYFNVSTDYLFGLTPAKTTNPTLRKISEYTRLSDAVIEKLHKYAPSSIQANFYRRFFDDLVTDNEVGFYVTDILKTYVDAMCSFHPVPFEHIPNEPPKPLPNGRFSIPASEASEWYMGEAIAVAEGNIQDVVREIAQEMLKEKWLDDDVDLEKYKWPVYSET